MRLTCFLEFRVIKQWPSDCPKPFPNPGVYTKDKIKGKQINLQIFSQDLV